MLVDSHCHLNLPKLKERMDEVVQQALDAGIGCMQTICTELEEYDEIVAITEKYPQVYGSVGVHPSDVGKVRTATAKELVELAQHPKIIGFGETGLDFYYDNSPRHEQQESFEQHILAAQQEPLPVIIHSRDAEQETAEIVISMMQDVQYKALIHCFTASKDFARKMLDTGLYISVAGIVTFKNAVDLQDAVKYVPLDRLLIETDAPFLAPVPMRGKTNEPAYVAHVAKFIAGLKEISQAKLAEITTENFFNLFDKAKAHYGS